MTTRRLALAALAVLLAAAAAVAWRLGRPPPDDEALVRAMLAGAARAAQEKRAGEATELLSERFRGPGGLDRAEARRIAVGLLLREGWVGVSLAGVALALEGDAGAANVDVVLARGAGAGKSLADLLPGEVTVYRFALGLEREAEGWRVVTGRWRRATLEEALAGPEQPAPPSGAAPPVNSR